MYVSMYVCIFIKLHITAQSSPVILVILCHSHWSSQGGINDTCYENLWSGATERGHTLSTCTILTWAFMYVCMVITFGQCRVRLPILFVVSWTGKMNFPCPRPCLIIWSRETGSAVPSRASLPILHTQAESGAYSRETLYYCCRWEHFVPTCCCCCIYIFILDLPPKYAGCANRVFGAQRGEWSRSFPQRTRFIVLYCIVRYYHHTRDQYPWSHLNVLTFFRGCSEGLGAFWFFTPADGT